MPYRQISPIWMAVLLLSCGCASAQPEGYRPAPGIHPRHAQKGGAVATTVPVDESVQDLVAMWTEWPEAEKNLERRAQAMSAACRKASKGKEVDAILDAVRSKIGSKDKKDALLIRRFFLYDVQLLFGKAEDKELVQLGEKAGAPFYGWPVDQSLIDDAIIRAMRRKTSRDGGGGYVLYLSKDACPRLYDWVRDITDSKDRHYIGLAVQERGVQSAIGTLVVWSWPGTLELIEKVERALYPKTEHSLLLAKLNRHEMKLKYQDDPEELARIVCETEDSRLRAWASARLFILEGKSGTAPSFLAPPFGEYSFDAMLLNGEQYQAYFEACRKVRADRQLSPEEKGKRLHEIHQAYSPPMLAKKRQESSTPSSSGK